MKRVILKIQRSIKGSNGQLEGTKVTLKTNRKTKREIRTTKQMKIKRKLTAKEKHWKDKQVKENENENKGNYKVHILESIKKGKLKGNQGKIKGILQG